jgi:hypothetical protein
MSHIAKLKLTHAQPNAAQLPPKERARAKVVHYLQQQRALVQGELTDQPYLPYRNTYRTTPEGERVRVQEPVHVRRGWFHVDGKLFFAIRYGAKNLPLDKAGNSAIELAELGDLAGTIDVLIEAVKAGELDAQLTAAVQERRKNFGKRKVGAKA